MKSPRLLLMLFGLFTFILAGCGGGGGGGGSSSSGGGDSTTTTTAAVTTTTVPSSGSTSSFEVLNLGEERTFTVPSNGVSFLLSAFGDSSAGNGIGIATLTDPNGNEVVSALRENGTVIAGNGYGNVLNPIIPSMQATPGTWSFVPFFGTTEVQLTLRTGDTPTSSTLTVKPFLTGTAYSASDIEPVLAVMETIYEDAGIQIEIESISTISGSNFSNVSSNFLNSTTSSLVQNGESDKANLFFIEDFSGPDSGLLGVASGIPGALGITSNQNGVLIGIDGHKQSGQILTQLLGETVAHEMGHLLGLFHPTESDGATFDPLDDTPQCTLGSIQPSDCIGFGADNLMFWQGDLNIEQSTLTPDQVHIINYSPIAR